MCRWLQKKTQRQEICLASPSQSDVNITEIIFFPAWSLIL
jgi:hypothetical protein